MGSSCKSCKVFAAGLCWSCHDPWVNMSDVTDVMKNSTTCRVTIMGITPGFATTASSHPVMVKISGVLFFCVTIPARGTFVSLCSISKHIVKPLKCSMIDAQGLGYLRLCLMGFLVPRMILQDQWCSCLITGLASDVAVLLQTCCSGLLVSEATLHFWRFKSRRVGLIMKDLRWILPGVGETSW